MREFSTNLTLAFIVVIFSLISQNVLSGGLDWLGFLDELARLNEIILNAYAFTTPIYSSTLGTTSVPGSDNSHFGNPTGVAVSSSGKLYVADQSNHRVQIFSSNGTYSSTLGTTGIPGSDNSHFNSLTGVAVDSSGKIYVADQNNHRIQVFNSSNAYVSTLGTSGISGSDNSHLNFPAGVAVDSSGKIYVADKSNHRIQVFNSSNAYVSTLGTSGISGSDNSHFSNPTGVVVDSSGKIYVADQGNHRIQIFRSNGTYSSTLGTSGTGGSDNSHFNSPFGVAVDSSGNIYVADQNNHRIQIFNSSNTYSSTLGTSGVSGSDNSHFNSPTGVAVSSSGKIYVADKSNDRIQIFITPQTKSLDDSIGITDKLSTVFNSTSTVGSGGTAQTSLPGGTSVSIKLPTGQSGTVTITTTDAPTTGSGGSTLHFVGSVVDITPPSNACATSGCVFSFNFTSAQVTDAGLTDPSQVRILHDHNNDGDFDDAGETLDTTITTISPGNFNAKATDFFTSKFAIGGVVSALALLGGGDSSSSQAFSAIGFLNLHYLSQNAKDIIESEDPYIPLKPSNDPTVPYYPFSLDDKNYLISRYANTIETVTEKVGIPVNLQLASLDKTISHVVLYTNMEGLNKEIGDSDTYIVYDKGSPLQIIDPHGFFSDVKVKTMTEGDVAKYSFSITFAKPMQKSDIFIREWDESKYTSDTKIKDAIQIMESPLNTQTSKDVIPNEITSQDVSSKSPDENMSPSLTSDDLTNYIKQWSGYSPTSISDSEMLDHIGIKGNHIPSWFMKTGKWILNGDVSKQEFNEAIQYMSVKGFIR